MARLDCLPYLLRKRLPTRVSNDRSVEEKKTIEKVDSFTCKDVPTKALSDPPTISLESTNMDKKQPPQRAPLRNLNVT